MPLKRINASTMNVATVVKNNDCVLENIMPCYTKKNALLETANIIKEFQNFVLNNSKMCFCFMIFGNILAIDNDQNHKLN